MNRKIKYYECKPCALKFDEPPEYKPHYKRPPYCHEGKLSHFDVPACSDCHFRIQPVYKEQKPKAEKKPIFPFVKVIEDGRDYYVPRIPFLAYLQELPETKAIFRSNGHIIVTHGKGRATFLYTQLKDITSRMSVAGQATTIYPLSEYKPIIQIIAHGKKPNVRVMQTLARIGVAI